jgi:hypothetical protein
VRPTILDVIDNFFGERSVMTVPGRDLMAFGEEVRRYEAAYEAPLFDRSEHPTYLGGWPSANFWDAVGSPLVMSSLLYSGQVLVRDPVCDWFSNDRYYFPVHLPSRGGYLGEDGKPAVAETRQFLSVVIPGLQALRPLIEVGIVVPAPFRAFRFEHRAAIAALVERMASAVLADPLSVSARFAAHELAIEDNARGCFVFAGGDAERQIRAKVHDALEFMASEYVFASGHGVHYTAPYRFEAFLCETGLAQALVGSPSERVVHALLRSKLPVFTALTPKVVSAVRDDGNFRGFRHDLYNTYRDIPDNADQREVDELMAEAEAAILRPKIDAALKDVERGVLGSRVVRLAGWGVGIGSGILAGAAGGNVVAQLAAATGADLLSRGTRHLTSGGAGPEPTRVIWRALVDHGRSAEQDVIEVTPMPKPADPLWGIADEPSTILTVSSGMLITDHLPRFDRPETAGGPSDPYGLCGCGSGEKWKFCCKFV